jgi:Uncharacterised ArCR, COG2043
MASPWRELEQQISSAVALPKRAVAVGFLDPAPAGLQEFSGTEPSGCSFWRLAAAGKAFYTVPENHFNCAVGAYTHNIPLSAQREKETEQTLRMPWLAPRRVSVNLILNIYSLLPKQLEKNSVTRSGGHFSRQRSSDKGRDWV